MEEATLVGSRGAMIVIVLIYTCCLAWASLKSVLFPMLIALALPAIVDMGTDMTADREQSENKGLKFVNEVAIGVAAGWIGFLVLVFTVGMFVLDSEKLFGVAFGAGVGLMVVFAPAAVVAAVCTGMLRGK